MTRGSTTTPTGVVATVTCTGPLTPSPREISTAMEAAEATRTKVMAGAVKVTVPGAASTTGAASLIPASGGGLASGSSLGTVPQPTAQTPQIRAFQRP
jgi:hypothetical protein